MGTAQQDPEFPWEDSEGWAQLNSIQNFPGRDPMDGHSWLGRKAEMFFSCHSKINNRVTAKEQLPAQRSVCPTRWDGHKGWDGQNPSLLGR